MLKTGSTLNILEETGLISYWRNKQKAFLDRLKSAQIRSLILDFDGTVYDGGKLSPALPDEEMISILNELAKNGLHLGFASGRGLSLREALRDIFAQDLWKNIFVAYQDGADIGKLDEDVYPVPFNSESENPLIFKARKELEELFSHWPDPPVMRLENKLIGLKSSPNNAARVFDACCGICLKYNLKVFMSGRMIDIVPPETSKLNLVPYLVPEIAAIADAGAWPGNDCELLAIPLGISVNRVSPNPDTCWTLNNKYGVDAAKSFLKSLKKDKNTDFFRYSIS